MLLGFTMEIAPQIRSLVMQNGPAAEQFLLFIPDIMSWKKLQQRAE
jgi:hypothetical protein